MLSKDPEVILHSLKVMEGKDPLDSTSADLSQYAVKNLENPFYTFGYMPELLDQEAIHPAIRQSLRDKIAVLKEAGHRVQEISFEMMEYLVPCYYVLTTAEASSNLSRFDGVRYGHQTEDFEDIAELYKNTRSEGFGTEVKRRIMMGTFVLSVGYFDAYFAKAQKVRRMICDKVNEIFDSVDFLLMPTTTDMAWKIGELVDDPVQMYLSDIFTVLANLTGLPAISVPIENNNQELPYGLQLIGTKFADERLIVVAQDL